MSMQEIFKLKENLENEIAKKEKELQKLKRELLKTKIAIDFIINKK